MVQAVGKYSDVKTEARRELCGPMQIFVPKKALPMDEWLWRELKEGGQLQMYLEREKGTSRNRLRQVARRYQDFKQNPKSDLELKCVVPAREFLRWRKVDPNFWDDNGNIKSFVRDNPEARPFKT
jgi:hypothetical protein